MSISVPSRPEPSTRPSSRFSSQNAHQWPCWRGKRRRASNRPKACWNRTGLPQSPVITAPVEKPTGSRTVRTTRAPSSTVTFSFFQFRRQGVLGPRLDVLVHHVPLRDVHGGALELVAPRALEPATLRARHGCLASAPEREQGEREKGRPWTHPATGDNRQQEHLVPSPRGTPPRRIHRTPSTGSDSPRRPVSPLRMGHARSGSDRCLAGARGPDGHRGPRRPAARRRGRGAATRALHRRHGRVRITFVNATGDADRKDYIFEVKGGGVAAVDYDNDGWMDLVFSRGSSLGRWRQGTNPGPVLYRNRGRCVGKMIQPGAQPILKRRRPWTATFGAVSCSLLC